VYLSKSNLDIDFDPVFLQNARFAFCAVYGIAPAYPASRPAGWSSQTIKKSSLQEEITMQEDFISRIQGFTDLPDRGMEAVVQRMEYPFLLHEIFIPGCSAQDEAKSIKDQLLPAIYFYMENWLPLALDKGKKIQDVYRHFFDFPLDFEVEKVYLKVVQGKEYCDIHVLLNNSSLQVKRFGNCLGIRIVSENSKKDPHGTGTAILEQFTKNTSSPVANFWHSADFIVPLLRRHREPFSVIIDLDETYIRLVKSCPFVKWIPFPEFAKIIDAYKTKKSVLAGKCQGISIMAEFIHYTNDEIVKSEVYRRGNVRNFEDFLVTFSRGDDLCLKITANSGLPKNSFSTNVALDLDVSNLQSVLKDVASMLYFQLSAQTLNDRQRK
jgi:hypothetical protein